MHRGEEEQVQRPCGGNARSMWEEQHGGRQAKWGMKAAEVRRGTSGVHGQGSDAAWARSRGRVPGREQELTCALTGLLWPLRGEWIPGAEREAGDP